MPRFDGTGPNGKGPKTGRGLGNCNKNTKNGNVKNSKKAKGKVKKK